MENTNNLNVQAAELQVNQLNKSEWTAPKCVVLGVGSTMTGGAASNDGVASLQNNAS